MRDLNDPDVQALAMELRGGDRVRMWPQGLEPNGACACLIVDTLDGDGWMTWAPGHQCDDPNILRLRAAAVLLAFREDGPDDGWVPAYADGSGYVTWLLGPEEAARRGLQVPPP